jgi:hypothetical protein
MPHIQFGPQAFVGPDCRCNEENEEHHPQEDTQGFKNADLMDKINEKATAEGKPWHQVVLDALNNHLGTCVQHPN